MLFADKLQFLMHITNTSNKELAAELSLDRSMISLMRTGKRKLPRDPAQVRKMALFFARRSTAEFQRHALSDMLGQASISSNMPTEALACHLENWLQGNTDIFKDPLGGIPAVPLRVSESPEIPVAVSGNQSMFFYGEEGRREVMRRMMEEIQRMEAPGSVLTAVDDNLEWLLSDYIFTKQIQSDMLEVMNRGFTFYQIMPPLNYINRFSESLKFWLPMYATGQMEVYYYPRLRGNLFRHSMIVVPGRCVQFSCAVALGSTSDITLFSTDPKLVDAYTKQYQEYLALCRPALIAHPDPKDAISCFLELFSRQGDTVQMVNSLAINSAPRELLEQCVREAEDPGWKKNFQMYLDEIPHFEQRLRQAPYIDMSYLASAEMIRSGKVCIASPFKTFPGHPCYTPEAYVLHLQNILRLMEEYENYYFVPIQDKEIQDYNLFVNESGMALLIRTIPPITMLEILRPEMVMAFREHLLRKAEAVGYDGIRKEKIRLKLRALIRELQA